MLWVSCSRESGGADGGFLGGWSDDEGVKCGVTTLLAGGHPAFLEMLSALTMGPPIYLIFFRLNQELENTY